MDYVYHIPLYVFEDFGIDPFDGSAWGCDPITHEEIEAALEAGDFEDISWQELNDGADGTKTDHSIKLSEQRDFHIQRIAALITQYSGDLTDSDPITGHVIDEELSVGDGYHRLAAAMYCENEFIPVKINDDPDVVRAVIPIADSQGDAGLSFHM